MISTTVSVTSNNITLIQHSNLVYIYCFQVIPNFKNSMPDSLNKPFNFSSEK